MRLLFAARAIDGMAGGLERMLIVLMNAMAARGHSVHLFTWDESGARAFYPVSADVTWHVLDMGSPLVKAGVLQRLKRARTIRALVQDIAPDLAISFQSGPFLALRLYTLGLGLPMIAAERNAPTRFAHTRNGARHRFIAFQSFRLASALTVQCESYRRLYPAFLHSRIVSIANPVSVVEARARPRTANANARFCLLSVGRLGSEKNYAVLLSAFARLAERFTQWDLLIVGEGGERRALEAQIDQLRLRGRIVLPGATDNPAAAYAQAHLFCLPSRWEGFPNALAEAQAHALPAIGFRDCAGVNELITHGESGLLADGNSNVDSLTDALAALMANGDLRATMGEAARVSVARYDPESIMEQWQALFSRVAGETSDNES